MAASLIAAASANSTSVTIPAHQVGDILVVIAYRSSTAVVPTVPTAGGTVPTWVNIDSGSGSSNGSIARAAVATATNHTTGTWTNANAIAVLVVRGAPGTSYVGGHAVAAISSGNSQPGPANVNSTSITQSNTSGGSLLIYSWGYRQASSFSTAPAGQTRATSTGTALCVNVKDSSTSDGALAQGATTTSDNQSGRSHVIEILPAVSAAAVVPAAGAASASASCTVTIPPPAGISTEVVQDWSAADFTNVWNNYGGTIVGTRWRGYTNSDYGDAMQMWGPLYSFDEFTFKVTNQPALLGGDNSCEAWIGIRPGQVDTDVVYWAARQPDGSGLVQWYPNYRIAGENFYPGTSVYVDSDEVGYFRLRIDTGTDEIVWESKGWFTDEWVESARVSLPGGIDYDHCDLQFGTGHWGTEPAGEDTAYFEVEWLNGVDAPNEKLETLTNDFSSTMAPFVLEQGVAAIATGALELTGTPDYSVVSVPARYTMEDSFTSMLPLTIPGYETSLVICEGRSDSNGGQWVDAYTLGVYNTDPGAGPIHVYAVRWVDSEDEDYATEQVWNGGRVRMREDGGTVYFEQETALDSGAFDSPFHSLPTPAWIGNVQPRLIAGDATSFQARIQDYNLVPEPSADPADVEPDAGAAAGAGSAAITAAPRVVPAAAAGVASASGAVRAPTFISPAVGSASAGGSCAITAATVVAPAAAEAVASAAGAVAARPLLDLAASAGAASSSAEVTTRALVSGSAAGSASGSGAVTAATLVVTAAASAVGSGAAEVLAVAVIAGSASAAGSGLLSLGFTPLIEGSAAAAGAGAGALTAPSLIAGTGGAVSDASAAVTAAPSLVAAGSAVGGSSAAVTAPSSVGGDSAGSGAGSASVTIAQSVSGTAAGAGGGVLTLITAAAILADSGAGAGGSAAVFTAPSWIAGTAAAAASAEAAVTVRALVAGSAAGVSGADGLTILLTPYIEGSAAAEGLMLGQLSAIGEQHLEGLEGVATGGGSLAVFAPTFVSAEGEATSSSAAAVSAIPRVAGSASASATASGVLTTSAPVSGSAHGQAGGSFATGVPALIAGSATGQSGGAGLVEVTARVVPAGASAASSAVMGLGARALVSGTSTAEGAGSVSFGLGARVIGSAHGTGGGSVGLGGSVLIAGSSAGQAGGSLAFFTPLTEYPIIRGGRVDHPVISGGDDSLPGQVDRGRSGAWDRGTVST